MCVRGDLLLDDETADGRQHEIEHDDVGHAVIEEVKRREAVVGFKDVEPGQRERGTVLAELAMPNDT